MALLATGIKESSRLIRSKVNYAREDQGKVYSFQGEVSFSDCQLPRLDKVSQTARARYARDVLDEEMKTYHEKSKSLNRFPQAIQLHAVNVPKDGNCLFHAVSVAVWSMDDASDTLRQLLFISVKKDSRLQEKWRSQQTGILQSPVKSAREIIDTSWDDLVDNISRHSTGTSISDVACRFSNPFYVYVLANILRRPIIVVAEATSTSITSKGFQDADIGGVYLPMEWKPTECCKTPVIIGYSFKHFYPLISEAYPESDTEYLRRAGPQLFPLVNSDDSLSPVRFLPVQRVSAAWDLVQAYLNVKELNVPGNVSVVTCVQIRLKPLATNDNLLLKYLDFCEQPHDLDATYLPLQQLTQSFANPKSHPSREYDVLLPGQAYHFDDDLNYLAYEAKFNNSYDDALTPTAPLPSLGQLSLVQKSSIMADRCTSGCGYRCSAETHPFCHECYEKEIQKKPVLGLRLSQPMGDPADERSNIVTVMSQMVLQCTDDHVLTPTAPPLSINSLSIEEAMPVLMVSQNELSKESAKQTQSHFYEETETPKSKQFNQNTKEVPSPHVTEGTLKDTNNVVPGNARIDKSPLPKGILWRETEQHLDSGTNRRSDPVITWTSLCGSSIHQASEESNSTEYSPQYSTETKTTVPYPLKQTPEKIFQKQNLTETESHRNRISQKGDLRESDKHITYPLPQTSVVENKLYRETNQPKSSVHNEGIAYADKNYSTAYLDSNLSAGKTSFTSALGTKAARQQDRRSHSPPYSSRFITTDCDDDVQHETTPSSNNLHSSYYSVAAQSLSLITFKNITSLGITSTTSQPSVNQHQKPVVVTNKSTYNNSGSTYSTPAASTSTSYREPTEKWTNEVVASKQRAPGRRCRTATCSNYSRGDNTGLCEACYKVIRRQRILEWEARQGVDVPDG